MAADAEAPPRLFVTDFDGTLTRHDFFHLVVEAFSPEHLGQFWDGYRAGRLTHFEALAGIFAGIRAGEEQMDQLIARAEPDPELAAWVARLRAAGWEVVVASAGCEWYIRRILQRAGWNCRCSPTRGRSPPAAGCT
ncbi:MAG: HAD-IB family phosphatase [Gemmataceae bacterium]